MLSMQNLYHTLCMNITNCAVCAHGYTSSTGYQCTKCKGTTDNVTIAMIVIVAVVLILVCLYFIKDLCKLQVSDTTHVDNNNAVSKALHKIVQVAKQLPWNKLRIPLVVMQLLTQFIAISGTQYPSIYANCIKWSNVVNLDTSWLLSAGCILHVNFYDKLLLITLAPVVIALIILVIHCRARYICYKKTDLVDVLAHAKAKHLSVFLTFTFLIYSAVSTVVFQTFACDYLKDTKESWLRADYSISCDTDTHAVFRKYAIFMVVLYPIGILAIYTVLLIRHRHNLNPTATATTATAITDIDVIKPTCLRALLNPIMKCSKGYYSAATVKANATAAAADNQQQQQQQQQQPQQEQLDTRQNDTSLAPIKFLWSPYRQEVYWWELVECIRRLLLTGFLVFILPGTAGQSAVACVFAGLSLAVFGLVQPFADTSDSNDYWFGTWILFLSTFIALVLKGDTSSESAYYNKFMAVILVVFNVLLLCSAAIQGVYNALVTARAAWRAQAAAARISY
jgi:hypothetical protein